MFEKRVILEQLRKLLARPQSELRYRGYKLGSPVLVHQIDVYKIQIGYCEYLKVDSTAYVHANGYGYIYFLAGLYILVETDQ